MIKICILSYWNAYGLNEKLLLGIMRDKIANLSLDMMELIQIGLILMTSTFIIRFIII